MATLTYAQSGVDRAGADRLVEKIALMAKATHASHKGRIKAAVGGYASLFELDRNRWIAASTDGVGTKLKLAFDLKNHTTVGIDLVAMSVNDLLCVGAEPLFFLDYFATGKLDQGVAEQVLQGIAEGCIQARCALVGGETAEMPGFYEPGEYDLAGFAVGSLAKKNVLPKEVRPGDVIIGLRSSGCHSNGYSLLRRILDQVPESERDPLARDLLTPTRIYCKSLLPLLATGALKGLAHITGSGFLNVPRISEKVSYELTMPPQTELPEIFKWIRSSSGQDFNELAQTFNMGIGMIGVVSASKASSVLKTLRKKGETAWELGRVIKRKAKSPSQVVIHDENETVILE